MNNVEFAKRQIEEFARVKELNIELLDVLTETANWFMELHQKTKINVPNIEAISYLIGKAHALLNEIDSPPKLQHRFRTPEDATEPKQAMFKYSLESKKYGETRVMKKTVTFATMVILLSMLFAVAFVPKAHAQLVGDINGDHAVDILDILEWSAALGSTSADPTPPWNPNADLVPDGEIDILDAIVISLNFGAMEPTP